MIEPARGSNPHEEPDAAHPTQGSSDPWARALNFTPSYQLVRQEWELGNLLRESIESNRFDPNLPGQSSDLDALKKSVSAYFTNGCRNLDELDRRLARIPQLVAESRLDTQVLSTQADTSPSNGPLPPHLQTFIAREAAVCILERLISDSRDSCERTAKDSFIWSFYENVLEDLRTLSANNEGNDLPVDLTHIVEKGKEEGNSQLASIRSSVALIGEASAEFISDAVHHIQETQSLPPSELFSISAHLRAHFDTHWAPQSQPLSAHLCSYLEEALIRLDATSQDPQTLPDCIRWFELSLDAFADEQSDLMNQINDFCFQVVRQPKDTPETAPRLLSDHPAHGEIAGYMGLSEGKDANHLMHRFERFTKLVDEAISEHVLSETDAYSVRRALIQDAYLTTLSTFPYQLGEEERQAMGEIVIAHGIELPSTPLVVDEAASEGATNTLDETAGGTSHKTGKELQYLIESFCARAAEYGLSAYPDTEIQSAMRAYLLEVPDGMADAITIKEQVTEVVDRIDSAMRIAVTFQEDPSAIGSTSLIMAGLYRELSSAIVHSMITAHLDGRAKQLENRVENMFATFDPQPPTISERGRRGPAGSREGSSSSPTSTPVGTFVDPRSLADHISAECETVAAMFQTYFNEAVTMARWIIDELCPVFGDDIVDSAEGLWVEECRNSFENLTRSIQATYAPRSG